MAATLAMRGKEKPQKERKRGGKKEAPQLRQTLLMILLREHGGEGELEAAAAAVA